MTLVELETIPENGGIETKQVIADANGYVRLPSGKTINLYRPFAKVNIPFILPFKALVMGPDDGIFYDRFGQCWMTGNDPKSGKKYKNRMANFG